MLIGIVGVAEAAPGDLDRSFSNDGTARVVPGSDPRASAVAVDAEGRIVVAGAVIDDGFSRPAVVRFLKGGRLDQTFGDHGQLVVNGDLFSEQEGFVFDLHLAFDSHSRILLAATVAQAYQNQYDIVVLRLLSDGTVDDTFGSGGRVDVDVGERDIAAGVETLDGDSVVVGGPILDPDQNGLLAARVTPSGDPDPTFSDDGVAHVHLAKSPASSSSAMTLDSRGRIVLAANGEGHKRRAVVLARLKRNGHLDKGFSGNGKKRLLAPKRFGRRLSVNDAAARGAGLLLGGSVVRSSRRASPSDAVLVKLRDSGSVARGFANRGFARRDISRFDEITALVPQHSGGRVVVAGRASKFDANYAAGWFAARYRRDGKLDRRFGRNGVARPGLQGAGWQGPAMTLQENDKILLAGWRPGDGETGESTGFVVARLRNSLR